MSTISRLLHMPYYLGVALLFIGNLFRIQHWAGWDWLILIGSGFIALFSVFAAVEIIRSHKAGTAIKVGWTLVMGLMLACSFFTGLPVLLVVLIAGNAYLRKGRKAIFFSKNPAKGIEFDSI